MIPIGLQLYTIGQETKRDFLGTIRRVGAIGYDGVEFAGYFDTSAEVLKRTLEESGLRAAGTHLGVPVLRDDLAAQIEYSLAIDCPTVLCPSFRVEERSAAYFQRMAEFFNTTAQTCQASGLGFATTSMVTSSSILTAKQVWTFFLSTRIRRWWVLSWIPTGLKRPESMP